MDLGLLTGIENIILRKAGRLSKWKKRSGIRQQGYEQLEIHVSSEGQGPSQLCLIVVMLKCRQLNLQTFLQK